MPNAKIHEIFLKMNDSNFVSWSIDDKNKIKIGTSGDSLVLTNPIMPAQNHDKQDLNSQCHYMGIKW